MNERLIIQALTGHILPVVATFTHPISKERQEGIAITFASNRFNCFDSDQTIYKNDAEALAKIRAFCQKKNDQSPGTYVFLSPEEYEMFGSKDALTAIWIKVKRKAITAPETLADVLSPVEIEILKRQSSGQQQGPDIMAQALDEHRPKATRGAASTKSQEMVEVGASIGTIPGTGVLAEEDEEADTPVMLGTGDTPTLPNRKPAAKGKGKG